MGFVRLIAADHNRLVQSCGSLLGIATGLLADKQINDGEVHFLNEWLAANEMIATQWPGDVLYDRVKQVVADGLITDVERAHLVTTLQEICGGTLDDGTASPVNQLAFDESVRIEFSGFTFCVTGEFVYGPRERVCEEIVDRGGSILKGVTKKLNYLVVGLRGSDEWKHGSYGTKVLKAVEYRRAGIPLVVVREDRWSAALKS